MKSHSFRTIRGEEGLNLITWSGDGQLQRADRPMGPWQTLTTMRVKLSAESFLPLIAGNYFFIFQKIFLTTPRFSKKEKIRCLHYEALARA